jgi:hypothetical protein
MPGFSTNQPGDYIAFGAQSAKDVEATTFYFLKHLSGSGLEIDPDTQTVREGGDGMEIGYSYRSMVKADGALIAAARPEITGRFGAGVLGSDSPTVVTASTGIGAIVDHFQAPQASVPYHTVEELWADERVRHTNVVFTQLDVEFEAGGPLKLTAQAMGGGTTFRPTDSAKTPVRESGKPLFYPGASLVITGASGAKITKGKTSFKRTVDDSIQTTGLGREDVVPLTFDVEADLTVKYEDATLWRRANFGGGTVVPVDLATIALSLTAMRASLGVQVENPLLEVTGAKVNRLDPDGKTMFVDVAARSVKSGTYPFWMRVRNTATTSHLS